MKDMHELVTEQQRQLDSLSASLAVSRPTESAFGCRVTTPCCRASSLYSAGLTCAPRESPPGPIAVQE